MRRIANDFHSWLRHSWKLLANRLTRDPKIVIHGNSCIILYIFDMGTLYPGKTAFSYWDGPQVSSKALVAKWENLLEWRRCNIYYSRDNVFIASISLQWRINGRDSVSNHQPHDCLLNRLFRRRSKKTSKLRVTDLCAGNSPGTDGFSAQMVSNADNVSIWWPLILSKHTKSHKNVSCLVLQLTLMNL